MWRSTSAWRRSTPCALLERVECSSIRIPLRSYIRDTTKQLLSQKKADYISSCSKLQQITGIVKFSVHIGRTSIDLHAEAQFQNDPARKVGQIMNLPVSYYNWFSSHFYTMNNLVHLLQNDSVPLTENKKRPDSWIVPVLLGASNSYSLISMGPLNFLNFVICNEAPKDQETWGLCILPFKPSSFAAGYLVIWLGWSGVSACHDPIDDDDWDNNNEGYRWYGGRIGGGVNIERVERQDIVTKCFGRGARSNKSRLIDFVRFCRWVDKLSYLGEKFEEEIFFSGNAMKC